MKVRSLFSDSTEPHYKLSAIVNTDEGYRAIAAWIETTGHSTNFRAMSEAEVDEFIGALTNLFGVDEEEYAYGEGVVDEPDACCNLMYLNWDEGEHYRMIPWNSCLTRSESNPFRCAVLGEDQSWLQ